MLADTVAYFPGSTQSHGYIVGWGTLTLINAGLAQSKGRGGLSWWLVSVLLGPVATLAIVLLPPVPPEDR
ncbi:hypothetical protein [Actinocrinis sp.]|uniref:hypothetical protein n=1 Tax=Actinocrinis sp. TaxID=1920516 RepID=UPI0032C23048